MKRRLMIGSVVVIVVLLASFVWPTRYHYKTIGNQMLRMDRFSGEAEKLTSYGWMPLRAAAPDPETTAPTTANASPDPLDAYMPPRLRKK